jgi:regulator of cell morphogenesis and NO signaling
MELLDIKVGELARENFAIIQLFNRNNIDFFCKGGQSLKEALDESGTGEEKFLKELAEIRLQGPQLYVVNVEKWPLDLLADYIQKMHHRYTERVLLEIKDLINKFLVSGSGGTQTIEEFKPTFELLTGGLATHMKKEELMLFPVIKKMVAASTGGNNAPVLSPVDKTIVTMIDEHDMQHRAVKKIRAVLNDYATHEGNDEYNKIVLLMRELAEDLSLHIHLENNILFPKAIELANRLS